MRYNKFTTTSGDVLLDLSGDSVTEETLQKGITAHNKSGEPIVGTNEGGNSQYEIFTAEANPIDNIVGAVLKNKIVRPTAEQIAGFVDGNVVFIPSDSEWANDVVDCQYISLEVTEGVFVSFLSTRLKFAFVSGTITLAYVWEEDVAIVAAALTSMGIDTSAVADEGWYVLGETAVAPAEDGLFALPVASREYMYPYNDYFYSLFDYYADGKPTSLAFLIPAYGDVSIAAEGKACNENIALLKRPSKFGIYTFNDPDAVMNKGSYNSLDFSYSSEFADTVYVDVEIASNDDLVCSIEHYIRNSTTDKIHRIVGGSTSSNHYSRILTHGAELSVSVTLNKTDIYTNIAAVYTNATIVSQTETKVIVSGLRHNTHIVIVPGA